MMIMIHAKVRDPVVKNCLLGSLSTKQIWEGALVLEGAIRDVNVLHHKKENDTRDGEAAVPQKLTTTSVLRITNEI